MAQENKSPGSESQSWIAGRRFLLRLEGSARASTISEEVDVKVVGEAVLQAVGETAKPGLKLERLGLAGSPIDVSDASSGGKLTILADAATRGLQVRRGAAHLDLETSARLHYPELDPPAKERPHPGCYIEPTFLPAAIRLSGEFVTTEEGLEARTLRITFSCAAGRGEVLSSLVLDLSRVHAEPLVPAPGSFADLASADNDECDPSLQVNRRRLTLQPVGFRASAADANPSGSTAAAQLATAQAVWGKCCIDLDVREIHLIEDADLKTSGDPGEIRAAYTDPSPNVIEVFFVQNPLGCCGGGTAETIGVASQKIVIAEPNGGNPVLVAHEIGHALGLLHPGPGSNSDAGTVMAPTGSPNIPGTELVTHYMCQNISQPALQTLLTTCCLSHDIGDHFIRDFPEDVGLEPSDPLPAGRTRYSMSNVWNRLTNTPGTFGANGPDHQNPFRFDADGVTKKTNYLFARVEQRNNLKARDAEVKFYIKHPGSGSGAISSLGQVAVPGTLGPATPVNVSLPWEVPNGTPNHSCVFAVVRSPAEPDGDQSGLNWTAFEALSRQDNDWAQRNLDVRQTAPNLGSGNRITSAPVVIRIPNTEPEEFLPFTLQVDGRCAERLQGLVVEVLGSERFEVKPGELVEVQPREQLRPGEDLALLVHASLPPAAEVGESFTVNVDPIVGEVPLVGYACEFRVARPDQVLAQCRDELLTALADLTEATQGTLAHRLWRTGRRLIAEGPWSLAELAQKTTALLRTDVVELAKEVHATPEARRYDLAGAMETWVNSNPEKNPVASLAAFGDLMRRFQMVAFHLLDLPLAGRPGISVRLDQLGYTFKEPCPGPYRELRFFAKVEDARGRIQTLKLPASHDYRFDPKARDVKISREALLYFGDPGGSLRIDIEARERDGLGREPVVARYSRVLRGDNDELKGRYKPGDERQDPEDVAAMKVYYRIQ